MTKKIIRLTRSKLRSNTPGRPEVVALECRARIDGVVLPSVERLRTMVVMMDGSAIYVREDPDVILARCELLGHPVGVFTREGAEEARRAGIE
jgi:hypothetical protein